MMRAMRAAAPAAAACTLVLALPLLAVAPPAFAQAFPSKPIRFVAAFPPGGPSDIVTRAVGRRLSEMLGQPVVIDNRAGAGGHIAAENIARSAPDGYSLLLAGSFVTIGPSLYRKLGYDVNRDFTAIGLVAQNQYLLVTHPSVPARNVNDLVKLARSRPGQLSYGSSGVGAPPHLAGELFKAMAKVDVLHVPYKGATPVLADLMGGQIDYYFGGISGALPFARNGKLRALAVTGRTRSSQLPEIPTVSESGLPGYDITTWFGLVSSAGVPKPVVDTLNDALRRMVAEPEMRKFLDAQGLDPVSSTPDEFASFMRAEVPKFAAIAKAAGLKPE
ncbi:MAG: Bug family tripartite tricarboxylate transporter substrate binding protein [bacterium]|jgi:tripartite-type tricarboxylate transporter receptor subunit TctC|nr:tripartite tricarboxylate transporter substrate binding protein [Betaproteobacteria bacterium]